MDLFIIRHAIAEDRLQFHLKSPDDSQRPLTEEGRRKFKKLAKRFQKLMGEVDIIVSSPYRRARQTAKLLQEHYPDVNLILSPALTPDADLQEFSAWCKKNLRKTDSRIVIVGHEPHLSKLASWLVFGSSVSRILLKKGGGVAIRIDGPVGPKTGLLQWVVTPRSLTA